jgi:uncharacterized protein DUF5302
MPVHGTPDGGGPSGDRSQPSRGGGSGIRARLEGMTSDEQSTTGPSEETKRKFREALDRKNRASKQREGESHLDGTSGAQHTQGPADHKREFRRKSG